MPSCGPHCQNENWDLSGNHRCPTCGRYIHPICCENITPIILVRPNDVAEEYQCIPCYEKASEKSIPGLVKPAGKSSDNDTNDEASIMFDNINKDLLLLQLKKLKAESILDCKPFPVSYKTNWDKLEEIQKSKTKKFWMENISMETRRAIKTIVDHNLEAVGVTYKERAIQTSVNDLARLLHLKKDPDNATLWSDAFDELLRKELDDPERVDPYECLAIRFNDYENYIYTNASCPVKGKDTNQMDKYASSNPLLHRVAKYCHDINPTDNTRPPRDGSWIQKHFKILSSDIKKQHLKFTKSGNQAGDDIENHWVDFMEQGGSVTLILIYVIAVMDLCDMNTLGKALPVDLQMNNISFINMTDEQKVIHARSYQEKEENRKKRNAEARRRQRHQNKQKRESVSTATSIDAEDETLDTFNLDSALKDSSDIANVIDKHLREYNDREAANLKSHELLCTSEFIMKHGDDEEKEIAKKLYSKKFRELVADHE